MKYDQLVNTAVSLIREAADKYGLLPKDVQDLDRYRRKDYHCRRARAEVMLALSDMGYTNKDIGAIFQRSSTTTRNHIRQFESV